MADLVDADYEEAISNTFSNFRRAHHYLLSPEKIKEYYDIIKSKFRYLHYAMAIFMSSKYYSINVALSEDEDDEMMSEDEEIHFKERLIVFLCLSMIRAKSRLLLRHYAIIEPFAYFSKGYQQPGRRTMTGGLNSTLPTSMKQLKKIYKRCLPTFNDRLAGTMRCHGAFDNHQKILPKKNPGDGKSAVTHVGTLSFLKEDRPYIIPNGTTMTSPLGTRFKVINCVTSSDTRVIIKGSHLQHDNHNHDKIPDAAIITDGFTYPAIG